MSGAPPLALREGQPVLESAAGAARALRRARACFGALCTELLTVPSPGAVESERYHQAARASHRLARRVLDINGVHVTVRGQVPSGPVVLACNHLGYLDPIVIGALLPLSAIAKSELAAWPFLGRVAAHLGTLFIRRGSAHHGALVLRRALRRLAAGVPVLNFPEGTTTDGSGPLLPFRRGLFGIARRAAARVVPVGLRLHPEDAAWIDGAPFLPHYWRMTTRPSLRALVRFGEPVDAGSFDSAQACADEVRERVERLLGAPR
ncbi:MAG TPA: lysophospholipid acyltransferase family protein [Myxococcaceae bacterium]|nr:lysophospholipid acyltransferase family protein [Myxococcaceae bacterium]